MRTVNSRVVLLSRPPVFSLILELCLPFLNFAGCISVYHTSTHAVALV